MIRALPLLLALACGCKTGVVNELFVEIVTDLPDVQLDRVELEASRDGKPLFHYKWRVTTGDPKKVNRLPGTFGLYTSDGVLPTVMVRVTGWYGEQLIVERKAEAAPVAGERRLLRMALDSGCRGQLCTGGQTCIASACAYPSVDGATLPGITDIPGRIVCGSPGYIDSATGVMLPVAQPDCPTGLSCVEGVCRGKQPGTVVETYRGGTGPLMGSLYPGAAVID